MYFYHGYGGKDVWRANAADFYGTSTNLPDIFNLTRAQVEAMVLDDKRFKFPASGLICDGTAKPGTPFDGGITVTFRANNGKSDGPDTMVLCPSSSGKPFTLIYNFFDPPASPKGMVFKGWNVNGVMYAQDEVVTLVEDTEILAEWTGLDAYVTLTELEVRAACDEDFSGRIVRAFYDRSGAMCAMVSEPLTYANRAPHFALPRAGEVKVRVFMLDDNWVPQYPAVTVTVS